MASAHLYDLVANDLATWMDQTSGWLADAMRDGGKAPFAADATEAEKLAYYDHQLFNKDSTPNMQGRQNEYERLGTVGYAKLLAQVSKARRDRLTIAPGSSGHEVEPPEEDSNGNGP